MGSRSWKEVCHVETLLKQMEKAAILKRHPFSQLASCFARSWRCKRASEADVANIGSKELRHLVKSGGHVRHRGCQASGERIERIHVVQTQGLPEKSFSTSVASLQVQPHQWNQYGCSQYISGQ